MVGLPGREKFDDIYNRFYAIRERDGQTDRQTDRHGQRLAQLFANQYSIVLSGIFIFPAFPDLLSNFCPTFANQ